MCHMMYKVRTPMVAKLVSIFPPIVLNLEIFSQYVRCLTLMVLNQAPSQYIRPGSWQCIESYLAPYHVHVMGYFIPKKKRVYSHVMWVPARAVVHKANDGPVTIIHGSRNLLFNARQAIRHCHHLHLLAGETSMCILLLHWHVLTIH